MLSFFNFMVRLTKNRKLFLLHRHTNEIFREATFILILIFNVHKRDEKEGGDLTVLRQEFAPPVVKINILNF